MHACLHHASVDYPFVKWFTNLLHIFPATFLTAEVSRDQLFVVICKLFLVSYNINSKFCVVITCFFESKLIFKEKFLREPGTPRHL